MDTVVQRFVLSHSVSLEDKLRIEVEGVDTPWFHGIINTFSLSVSKSLFVIIFI